jgi:hypothetical protein
MRRRAGPSPAAPTSALPYFRGSWTCTDDDVARRASVSTAGGTESHCTRGDRPMGTSGRTGIAYAQVQLPRRMVLSHSLKAV